MRQTAALITALLIAFSSPAWAVNPDEILDDPIMEQRARDISANLRCLVCQNQSIDDSDAELARDLRVIVRERLVSGDSDSDVMEYVVGRYGEFVLLRPQLSMQNLLLWGTPILVLLLGGIAAFVYSRRSSTIGAGAPLSQDEENRLIDLLDKTDFER
ncbi:MAG: cytochrome c-type biogenesis protein [Ahrensia sp.]|nr:cytochrome c-type biogenesis protein [Ahrensia sp.]